MYLLTGIGKEACGGSLLKKFMSEISDDPYDVSDFSEFLPCNFFRFNIFVFSRSYSELVCLCGLLLICV